MKCSILFDNIKQYWPSQITIEKDYSNQLNKLYWDVDSKIDDEKDHWLSVSAWAFHQAIDPYITSEICNGKKVIRLSDMPIQLFNKQMLFNLEEDCWEKERLEYQQP